MKPLDYYATLDALELARDPDFRAWVTQPTPEQDRFWESMKTLFPRQQPTLEQARWLVLGLEATWQEIPEPAVTASFQRLRQKQQVRQPAPRRTVFPPVFYRYAAAVAAVLLAGLGWWYSTHTETPIEYRTAYGQIQTITLPDGTVVTLNANSLLTMAADWQTENQREVRLTGEAFFDVNKKPLGRRMPFVVHTGAADVVVLGTRFNVNTRRARMQVVLQEGKVKIDLPKQPDLLMQPGDLVETTNGQPIVRRTRVNADRYVAWRENLLVFDDESVSEIVQRLKDQYDLTVRVSDSKLLTERISLSAPADNPDLLLRLLAETFHLQIHKQKNQIVLSR
ncbi:FecR family protein [Larkinella sp. VNQ87]|uniref:FecR family protein n=1 Tax=Larkinella sp. VNQ87 TaxID=3400921 RepID=UPI003C07CE0B